MAIHPVKIQADILPVEVPKVYTKTDLTNLVYQYAEEYHVKPQVMINTINCEDTSWEPKQQSNVVTNGMREESYGLAQIHLPSNTKITKQQAEDPEFAIEFMAKNMSEGHASMWSCYRRIYN